MNKFVKQDTPNHGLSHEVALAMSKFKGVDKYAHNYSICLLQWHIVDKAFGAAPSAFVSSWFVFLPINCFGGAWRMKVAAAYPTRTWPSKLKSNPLRQLSLRKGKNFKTRGYWSIQVLDRLFSVRFCGQKQDLY
ncbi:hypothetical protein MRX96_031325 [Rhipicephalus microplus]